MAWRSNLTVTLKLEEVTKLGYESSWFTASNPAVWRNVVSHYLPGGGYFTPISDVVNADKPEMTFIWESKTGSLPYTSSIPPWVARIKRCSQEYRQQFGNLLALRPQLKGSPEMSTDFRDDLLVCSREDWRGWFRTRRKDRQDAKRVFRAAVMIADMGPREFARKLLQKDVEATQAVMTVGVEHPEWDIDIDRLKEILEFILEFIKAIMALFI